MLQREINKCDIRLDIKNTDPDRIKPNELCLPLHVQFGPVNIFIRNIDFIGFSIVREQFQN